MKTVMFCTGVPTCLQPFLKSPGDHPRSISSSLDELPSVLLIGYLTMKCLKDHGVVILLSFIDTRSPFGVHLKGRDPTWKASHLVNIFSP